jgi:hypothetical protein
LEGAAQRIENENSPEESVLPEPRKVEIPSGETE